MAGKFNIPISTILSIKAELKRDLLYNILNAGRNWTAIRGKASQLYWFVTGDLDSALHKKHVTRITKATKAFGGTVAERRLFAQTILLECASETKKSAKHIIENNGVTLYVKTRPEWPYLDAAGNKNFSVSNESREIHNATVRTWYLSYKTCLDSITARMSLIEPELKAKIRSLTLEARPSLTAIA